MQGHVIVCGTDALANRITEGLQAAGATVVTIHEPGGLKAAIVTSATAIVCAGDDDAVNLEISLLARELNPTVRVVTRLANSVLRAAVAEDNGPGAVLDVADLAAPSVVEACLARTTHTIAAAGVDFAAFEARLRRTLAQTQTQAPARPVAAVATVAPVAMAATSRAARPVAARRCSWRRRVCRGRASRRSGSSRPAC